jgi:lysozyme
MTWREILEQILLAVKAAFSSGEKPAAVTQTAPTVLGPGLPLTMNEAGLALLKKFEGCLLTSYPDPASALAKACQAKRLKLTQYRIIDGWESLSGTPWTIGYGETKNIHPGMTWTQEQAETALTTRLREEFEPQTRKALGDLVVSSNQFSALVSFCYNCGAGNLKKVLTEGLDKVPDKLLLFNGAKGQVLPGLVKRRQAERDLFLLP